MIKDSQSKRETMVVTAKTFAIGQRNAANQALRIAGAMICLGLGMAVPAAADPVTSGYLGGQSIGYTSPTAPDNDSPSAKKELDAIRKAQFLSEERHRQAFEDAAAFSYDQLLPRFNEAAGTRLDLHSRPILAHMLRRVLDDMGSYVKAAKDAKERARPYVEDPAILPCETDYLRPSDMRSYPSGHSANGYVAALLLADVMPERASLLLARGIRYGDNRVVCGVHHPTDVEEGRRLAKAYYARVSQDPQFEADRACAIEEHRDSIAVRTVARPAWSAACQQTYDQSVVEAVAVFAKSKAHANAFEPD